MRSALRLTSGRTILRSRLPAAGTRYSSTSKYPGAQTEFTTTPKFVKHFELFPTYRLMDESGNLQGDIPQVEDDELLKMYETMCQLRAMDDILYDAQRMGRISFYMTSFGEESTHVGTAAALDKDDVVFAQYREAGVLMWRGFSLEQFMHQCTSNSKDLGKGRQMPVHYGCKELNFQTISSPLGTQIPQAAGAAYALKRSGKQNIVICYFGDGAASEGDFHAALNFAATLECPVVFFCRNNGYAISTPTHEQYRGDGIAARGPAYGIPTLRCDGNDLFAVLDVTQKARDMALKENTPVLIEAMTYRGGHHSTSDDASRYRESEETDYWMEKGSPIGRMYKYMVNKGIWDEDKDKDLRQRLRKDVLSALAKAETEKQPPMKELFTDVYDKPIPILVEQEKELMAHLEKYGEHYKLETFEK